MDALNQLTQVAQVMGMFGTNDDPVTAEVVELIAGQSAKLKAQAFEVFTEAKISEQDRKLLMPASKRALRALKEEQALEQDRLDREAQRAYDTAMREQRLLQEQAATALAQSAARNAGATI